MPTPTPAYLPGPILRKAFVVLLVSTVVAVPIGMLRGLVAERMRLAGQAEATVAAGWGGRQQLGGPVLMVPVEQRTENGPDGAGWRVDQVFVLPDTLAIDARMETESRSVGVYSVPVYRVRLRMAARFLPADLAAAVAAQDAGHRLRWGEAVLLLPITEVKAIRALDGARWHDKPIRFVGGGAGRHSGVRAPVDPTTLLDGQPVDFRADLMVAGTDSLRFLPLARTTDVSLTADWPDPAFSGAYLPAERGIDADGFSARWQVLELNRDYPQTWMGADRVTPEQLGCSAFGASLFLPADIYQRNERSMKYALLFIVMTFATLFLIENLAGPPLHAVQYGLVGLGLSIFFLLLLALSEHMGFDAAYWTGTAALVSLIGVYLSGALRSRRRGWAVASAVALLYGLLFVILNAADTALLIGSLVLFAMLAAVMILTRQVDWYAVGHEAGPQARSDAVS